MAGCDFVFEYSGTSDSGPSENIIDLSTKDTGQGPKNFFPIVLIHFEREDNLSTKDTTAEFILSPKCPLFRGSTALSTLALRTSLAHAKMVLHNNYTGL